MDEIPGYDAWKLMTPEEDEEFRNRLLRRRSWDDEDADARYDAMRDREFEDDL